MGERDHLGFCLACGNLACCGDVERARVAEVLREELAKLDHAALWGQATHLASAQATAVRALAARLGIEMTAEGTL